MTERPTSLRVLRRHDSGRSRRRRDACPRQGADRPLRHRARIRRCTRERSGRHAGPGAACGRGPMEGTGVGRRTASPRRRDSSLLAAWRSRPGQAPGGAIRSIAVLPLDNYSADSTQDYFAEGMTDELTSDLAIDQPAASHIARVGDAVQGKESPADSGDREGPQRRCDRRGVGDPVRRPGADHRTADRCPRGPAPLGPDLRAQVERRAGAPGGAGVGHCDCDQRAADASASNPASPPRRPSIPRPTTPTSRDASSSIVRATRTCRRRSRSSMRRSS